jgi:hypothetical protein
MDAIMNISIDIIPIKEYNGCIAKNGGNHNVIDIY